MSSTKTAPATAREVREFVGNTKTIGRISVAEVAKFNAENTEGKVYQPAPRKAAPAPVEVKFSYQQKSGRKASKTKSLTVTEARTLLGPDAPKRGVLSAANVARLSEILSEQHGQPSPTA